MEARQEPSASIVLLKGQVIEAESLAIMILHHLNMLIELASYRSGGHALSNDDVYFLLGSVAEKMEWLVAMLACDSMSAVHELRTKP